MIAATKAPSTAGMAGPMRTAARERLYTHGRKADTRVQQLDSVVPLNNYKT